MWKSAILIVVMASAGLAQDHWVATWAAAQQPYVATPVTPQPPSAFHNQTVRMIAHTSVAGQRARLHLSNAYGTAPLTVGAVHLALRGKDSAIVAGSDRTVTFSGKSALRIPPGASVVSDAVSLAIPATADLAVSVYIPEDSGPLTLHSVGLHTTYISAAGNFTDSGTIADATATRSFYWLSEIDVMAPRTAGTLVTFGDSITDGTRSTPELDQSWPSALARRLAAGKAGIAVANEGISGNRILTDVAGSNALARFDRDVLSIAGVKWVTILEGINDINRGPVWSPSGAPAADLILGMSQMIERAHTHGVRVIGCTITPFEGLGSWTEEREEIREAVNQWIRTSKAFDAVVDFDAVVRDPASPKKFRAEFDSGDHLHPGDAGYTAMADAIDLKIFGKTN